MVTHNFRLRRFFRPDLAIRGIVTVFAVACLGCASQPQATPETPVASATPEALKKLREDAPPTVHSRADYLRHSAAVRVNKPRAKSDPTPPAAQRRYGKKVYQGLYKDAPRELLERGDLILELTPDSEEVRIYEPYSGENDS